MPLLLLSFIAGFLTVLAPCTFALLPVIIGGSIARSDQSKRSLRAPITIALSLALSVVLFTLLLKATTELLFIPDTVWQIISGAIIALLGITFVFPDAWERATARLNFSGKSTFLLTKSGSHKGIGGDILTGMALGPVFNSCNPTYALLVASVLPASFLEGFVYIVMYAIGLALSLLLLAIGGQTLARKLGWLVNPYGTFRRAIGVVFILVAIAIVLGLDKDLQSYVLEQGWYDPIAEFESRF